MVASKETKLKLTQLSCRRSKVAKPGPKKQLTRSQRILRGPLFWIIAAIVAVTVFGQDLKCRKSIHTDQNF